MHNGGTPDDRFLARRYGFLGLPSEQHGGSLSYAGLQAELGDDNAAALVSKIGVLIQAQGLDRLGIPLQNAVDHVLQSLTPDERRTMAEGGTVPRVQELVSSEVAQAQAQQKLNSKRDDRADKLALASDWSHYAQMAMAMRGDGGTATNSGSGVSSSARYDTVSPYGNWSSPAGQAYMRDFALKTPGAEWAAIHPGLLSQGPEAVKALAASQLKEDGYGILRHDLHMNDRDVVAGARYAVRNHANYNEIAKSYRRARQGLQPSDQSALDRGIRGVLTSQPGEDERRKKDQFNNSIDTMAKKYSPDQVRRLRDLQDKAHTQHKAEVDATNNVAVAATANNDARAAANAARASLLDDDPPANAPPVNGASTQPVRTAANTGTSGTTSGTTPNPDPANKVAANNAAPKIDPKAGTIAAAQQPKKTVTATAAKPGGPTVA